MSKSEMDLTIMRAIIEVDGTEGASVDEIEQNLTSTQNNEPDLESIQSRLDAAVEKGHLSKLSGGKYKIKEHSDDCSGQGNCCALQAVLTKAFNEMDVVDSESDQEAKSADEKDFSSKLDNRKCKLEETARREEVVQDANKSAGTNTPSRSETGNVEASKLDNEKYKLEETTRREEVVQDANKNADPDTPSRSGTGSVEVPEGKRSSSHKRVTFDRSSFVDKDKDNSCNIC